MPEIAEYISTTGGEDAALRSFGHAAVGWPAPGVCTSACKFLGESVLLSALGGAAGIGGGAAATAGYASLQGWIVVVPILAVAGGIAIAVVLGALAGLYPAVRAARLAPASALRSV